MDLKDIALGVLGGGTVVSFAIKLIDGYLYQWMLKKRNPIKFMEWVEKRLNWASERILSAVNYFDNQVLDKAAEKLEKTTPEIRADLVKILERIEKKTTATIKQAIDILKN